MTAPLQLTMACPQCGNPVSVELRENAKGVECPACNHDTNLPEMGALLESAPLQPCCVCGSDELYSQRDFNRKLGLLIVAVGMAFGPFTHWISVGVAVVFDAVLYVIVKSVAICYACNAQYRGFAPARKPEGFEIAIHDVYKFAKRHPPRREVAVAGPLQTRLRNEGSPPGPPKR